ncbi:hypothetical protein MNBD_DELTA01-774 [hydrothermal vent metagenome]|uniref:Copper resistance protein D domain-containing protein n=1 Tax=hydrothermal vent metagenome TaxID=652676 RepID=A0A3B0RKX3_9ZZZZ
MFKLSLYLHIISAMFWIGGMLFITLVIAPYLSTIEDRRQRSAIYQVVGKKFRSIAWIAIIIMLVTGPINLYYIGVTPSVLFDIDFARSSFGMAIWLKILVIILLLISSLAHDFWLGPKARNSPNFSKIAKIMGRSNLLLALIIALLAVFIRAGGL